ncbi:MAG: hypothetical protein WB347_22355, partial [Terriglobales bacterium]
MRQARPTAQTALAGYGCSAGGAGLSGGGGPAGGTGPSRFIPLLCLCPEPSNGPGCLLDRGAESRPMPKPGGNPMRRMLAALY